MKRTKWNGVKTSTKRKGPGPGRPSDYAQSMPDRAYRLCLLGLIDKELAVAFGVTAATINRWKIERPEFAEALINGKIEADAVIAESLYMRAKGYEHPEDRVQWVAAHIDQATKEYVRGQWRSIRLIKYYPPETQACKMWLQNRRGENWVDQIKHVGEDGGPITLKHQLDLSTLSDMELVLAEKLGFGKQLTAPTDKDYLEEEDE